MLKLYLWIEEQLKGCLKDVKALLKESLPINWLKEYEDWKKENWRKNEKW